MQEHLQNKQNSACNNARDTIPKKTLQDSRTLACGTAIVQVAATRDPPQGAFQAAYETTALSAPITHRAHLSSLRLAADDSTSSGSGCKTPPCRQLLEQKEVTSNEATRSHLPGSLRPQPSQRCAALLAACPETGLSGEGRAGIAHARCAGTFLQGSNRRNVRTCPMPPSVAPRHTSLPAHCTEKALQRSCAYDSANFSSCLLRQLLAVVLQRYCLETSSWPRLTSTAPSSRQFS